MKEKFIQFLKDNGALEKFEANIKDEKCQFSRRYLSIDEIIEAHDKEGLDVNVWSNVFWWDDSPEGWDYWNDLDNKWRAICASL